MFFSAMEMVKTIQQKQAELEELQDLLGRLQKALLRPPRNKTTDVTVRQVYFGQLKITMAKIKEIRRFIVMMKKEIMGG